ncbi:PAS domain S-box protein [Arhodomonas aquaeolei]|uniref:PAS domain S-box protein n=1 Tax=Arhodomonas aquaeolei TaxID=2369 RepID=UPI002169DC51|nr:PAS domain S-box protein [Arhodomonas aquaeolei]MCS4504774.1 PAS domain S-box protein [Arhodomonas aquaeolei]
MTTGRPAEGEISGEHALRRRLAALEGFVEAAPVGRLQVTAEGSVAEANPAAARLTGVDEPVGRHFVALLDPGAVCSSAFEAALAGGEGVLRLCLPVPGGVPGRWLVVTVRALEDGADVMLEALDERREAVQRSRAERTYFRQSFHLNIAPKLLIEAATGRIADANDSALAFYGYTRGQITTLHVGDLNTLAPDMLTGEIDRARREQERFFRFRHRTANGELREVEVYSGPVFIDGREYLHSIVHDVTRAHRYQQWLERYRRIFESLPVGVYSSRPADGGRVTDANPAMARILGAATPDELIGRSAASFHPDSAQARAVAAELMRAGVLRARELPLRTLDGREVWVAVTARVRDSAGERWIDGIVEDISERRALAAEQRLLAKAFRTSQALMITDANGVIERVNPAFTTLTGYPASEAVGATPALLRSGHHDEAFFARMWTAVREQGRWEGEIWNRCRDGVVQPHWESIAAVYDHARRVEHYVCVFHDISEHKRLLTELEHLATHDRLTGVTNRGRLYTLLQAAESAFTRYSTPFSVVLFDIDWFKSVNDRFGHPVGDRTLIELTHRVAAILREADQFGRWGGEEFLVLAAHTDLRGATVLAERIRRAVADAPFPGVGPVSVSLGVAEMRFGWTLAMLTERADAALYEAKATGRDRVVVAPA